MAQVTAKTAREVLDWIETNQHHIGDAQTPGFFVLKGYQNTLRIPTTLYADMADLIEPGGEFDTRMFRAKQKPFCPPEQPEDGYECLAFYRGRWRHVRWNIDHGAFSLGYAIGFIMPTTDRAWAPLPAKPEGAEGFYDFGKGGN